jgi:lactobin A/cerein 7B family class IIb bacteriocin
MYKKGENMELSKYELANIYGGGFKYGIAIGIGAVITFIIGVIDGYLRPLKCNR